MSNYTCSIGDFFEEATVRLFGGVRFTTESHVEYCPDVLYKPNRYFEVKASGRGGRIIIYRRRLIREMEWCEKHNCTIEYVVWAHKCFAKDAANEQELLESLAETTRFAIRVPIQTIFDITSKIPHREINRKNPLGYVEGWCIPRKLVFDTCSFVKSRTRMTVDGNLIKNFTIHAQRAEDLP